MDTQEAYLAKWKADLDKLGPVKRAVIDLTMQNESFVLQRDESRLMAYIADHGSMPWQDGSRPLMRQASSILGMVAIGNARALIERCLRLGYIKGVVRNGHGQLVLTDTGWAMLELHEMQEEFEEEQNS